VSTKFEARCPAAELTHTVVSHGEMDVRCRIRGNLRDAEGSPCCGEYIRCPIWKMEKDRIEAGKKAVRAQRMLTPDAGWVAA
jgi:hypothetical protein